MVLVTKSSRRLSDFVEVHRNQIGNRVPNHHRFQSPFSHAGTPTLPPGWSVLQASPADSPGKGRIRRSWWSRWHRSQRTAVAGRPRGGCRPCRCGRPGWCAPGRRARGLLHQGRRGSTRTVPRFKRSRLRSRMRSMVAPRSGWPGQTKVASGWPGTARSDFSKVIRSYLPKTGSPTPIRRSRWRIKAGTWVIS
jgi:hypothetical protein